jgi:hypothetical protein
MMREGEADGAGSTVVGRSANLRVVVATLVAVAAFCAGEPTKSLPPGVHLEAYVLARLARLREREIVGARCDDGHGRDGRHGDLPDRDGDRSTRPRTPPTPADLTPPRTR